MSSAGTAGVVFDSAGSGDAVVMIHGLGGSSNTFQPLMSVLRNYAVHRPDMPGSGRSPVPSGDVSIGYFAKTIVGGLKSAGVERAHFVGHSLGTLVCQHIATEFASVVRTLTLFGGLTEPSEAARKGLIERARTAREGKMDVIAEQIIANTLSPCTHSSKPEAVAFVRESIMRQDTEGYAKSCEALSKATAYQVENILVPTLLIAGDIDPVAPQSMGTALRDKMPNASLVVLDRCGHWIPIEKAQESSRKLSDFLQSHMN